MQHLKIFEEFIKNFYFFGHEYQILKNTLPKHVKPEQRFISDLNGDLYCIIENEIYNSLTHSTIAILLKDNNININDPYDHTFKSISWQRLDDSNKLYLGESYYDDNLFFIKRELLIKVAEKNPAWKFYFKKIYNSKIDDKPIL